MLCEPSWPTDEEAQPRKRCRRRQNYKWVLTTTSRGHCMTTTRSIAFACGLIILAATALAQTPKTSTKPDQFSAVRCNADVKLALIGRSRSHGRVLPIEEAHRDIQLSDVGGSIVNDSLFLAGWAMCGREFQ